MADSIQKICAVCGIDVSRQERTKDREGRYYCQPCWDALVAQHRGRSQTPAFACATCHQLVTAEEVVEVDGAFVCTACHHKSDSAGRIPLQGTGKTFGVGSLLRSPMARVAIAAVVVCIIVALALLLHGRSASHRVVAGGSSSAVQKSAGVDPKEKEARVLRDTEASRAFVREAKPFLEACSSYRDRFKTWEKAVRDATTTEDLIAVGRIELDLSRANLEMCRNAPRVEAAFRSLPADVAHLRTLCEPIRAAAEGIQKTGSDFARSSTEYREMMVASFSGRSNGVDEGRIRRAYLDAVTSVNMAAGVAVDTAKAISDSFGQTAPISPAGTPRASGTLARNASAASAENAYRRGLQLIRGDGGPQDVAAGLQSLQQAADAGHPEAMFEIGTAHYIGNGAAQDRTVALNWWLRSASAGHVRAMFNVGKMYFDGDGTTQDIAVAVQWWRRGAKAGDPASTNELGRCYLNGTGVQKDDAEAVRLFRKSADLGNETAMRNVGIMYAQGRGVPKDPAEAIRWFRKAAEKGDGDAMWLIAAAYRDGTGVAQDEALARQWARNAAQRGNQDAKFYVLSDLIGAYLGAKVTHDELHRECLAINGAFDAAVARRSEVDAVRLHEMYIKKAAEAEAASAQEKATLDVLGAAIRQYSLESVIESIDRLLVSDQISPTSKKELRELRRSLTPQSPGPE